MSAGAPPGAGRSSATGVALQVVQASRVKVEYRHFIEVMLFNAGSLAAEPGGLRLLGHGSEGDVALSMWNAWPIEPQAAVHLNMMLPRAGLRAVDFVAYLALDGTLHPVGGSLAIGWFFSDLVS